MRSQIWSWRESHPRETPADSATVLKVTACPWRWSCSMAWCAADSAAWWRRALASARKDELSARAIAGALILERFQGGDDLVQVGLDAAQVLGKALLASAVGLGDE